MIFRLVLGIFPLIFLQGQLPKSQFSEVNILNLLVWARGGGTKARTDKGGPTSAADRTDLESCRL